MISHSERWRKGISEFGTALRGGAKIKIKYYKFTILKNGESMIKLFVFQKPKSDKILNYSAFCAKSEAFLRFNKIEHKIINFKGNPAKFKNSKLPVIQDGNDYICDSYFIEEYLTKKFNIKTDKNLSELDKANGFAYTKMCEEFLYWSILHERWFIDENWEKLKEQFFSAVPGIIRGFVTNMIRKNLKKSTVGHGIGRHSDKEIHDFGAKTIKSIATFIGDKDYLLGSEISSFDLTMHSFVSNAVYCELNPELRAEAAKYKNLEAYSERVLARL